MLDNTSPLVYNKSTYRGRLDVLDAEEPTATKPAAEKSWWEKLLSIFD